MQPNPARLEELVRGILMEIGEDPDKRDYVVSNARLREAGFEARRGLEVGIPELVKAYRTLPLGRYRNA
jgi:hypothetical protein